MTLRRKIQDEPTSLCSHSTTPWGESTGRLSCAALESEFGIAICGMDFIAPTAAAPSVRSKSLKDSVATDESNNSTGDAYRIGDAVSCDAFDQERRDSHHNADLVL
jgi:hypothetical protein